MYVYVDLKIPKQLTVGEGYKKKEKNDSSTAFFKTKVELTLH